MSDVKEVNLAMSAPADYPNENPVDYLIRRLGMTRSAFTKSFGFGENFLLLVAQGRKEGIGDLLQATFEREFTLAGQSMSLTLQNKYGVAHLSDAWFLWRQHQRSKVVLPPLKPGVGSPMSRIVRHFGSVSQTAKHLRVRDLMVRKYMDSPRMPQPIRKALDDIQPGYADELDKKQTGYFKDKGRKR